jgi:hypothetical protein
VQAARPVRASEPGKPRELTLRFFAKRADCSTTGNRRSSHSRCNAGENHLN